MAPRTRSADALGPRGTDAMPGPGPAELCAALHELLAIARADPSLAAEIARAEREFFGLDPTDYLHEPSSLAAAQVRFSEWYLLERESEVLGEVPLRLLLERRQEPLTGEELLPETLVGVFVVQASGPQAVALRDSQNGRLLEMASPRGLDTAPGQLLIGRLFQDDLRPLIPSVALTCPPFGPELAGALRRDLAANKLDRRLTQIEIEHLLFRRLGEATKAHRAQAPIEHLEAELTRFLREAGKSQLSSLEISRALRDAVRPGPIMGPIQDEIAFDTQADLDELRRRLLELWNAHHAGATSQGVGEEPADAPPAAHLGRAVLDRIDQGIAQHEDLDDVFEEVEGMLDGDGESIEGSTAAASAEALPTESTADGDLAPLIEEFLWETGPPDRARDVLQDLLHQQHDAPVPRLDLELIEAGDLLRLLLRGYLAAPPAQRASAVRQTFKVLRQFFSWALQTQRYVLEPVLTACEEAFLSELDRVHAASLRLSDRDRPDGLAPPILMRVAEISSSGPVAQPIGSEDLLQLEISRSCEMLRAGDLILGVIHRTTAAVASLHGMVVVLPGAVEDLLG